MSEQEFDYSRVMKEFLDDRKVWQQILDHLKSELIPDKSNWLVFVFSLFSGVILAVVVGVAETTVQLAREISAIFLDVQIALFGCIFAVYSILLAFLSDEYVKKLLSIDYHQQSSYLSKSTRYYEAALLIYFVSIILSLCMKIILICIPEGFLLTDNMAVNESLASLMLALYFVFSIRVICELKSVVANTLLLFRSSMAFKIQRFAEEDESSTELHSESR